jgi:hypothetical protein
MAQFSGAVKIGDLNDFIAPSQACVVSLQGQKQTPNQAAAGAKVCWDLILHAAMSMLIITLRQSIHDLMLQLQCGVMMALLWSCLTNMAVIQQMGHMQQHRPVRTLLKAFLVYVLCMYCACSVSTNFMAV